MRFTRLRWRHAGRTAGILTGLLVLGTVLAVPAEAAIGNLGPGSSGPQVVIWQQDLNFFIKSANTCHPTLTVDGQYGQLTTNATKCFQSVEFLTVDGLAGPQTRAKMCSVLDIFGGSTAATLVQETCG